MEEIDKICNFIDINRSDKIKQRVIDGCRFDIMKLRDQIYGRDNKEWPENQEFISKGKVGSHKSELSPDLTRIIEQKAGPVAKKVGYVLN